MTPVLHLLAGSRPSDVAGLVAPIIVDSIDRKFWARPGSDVFEECGEIFAPLSANLDTAPAIVAPDGGMRIGASIDDAFPYFIFGAPTGPRSISVRCIAFCSHPVADAPTRSTFASSEVAGHCHYIAPTVAVTIPHYVGSDVLSP